MSNKELILEVFSPPEVRGKKKLKKSSYLYTCGVFFFSNLWGRWVCSHPQEDFAKFDYISKFRTEYKFRNDTMVLATL
jgi:hypothetical protein